MSENNSSAATPEEVADVEETQQLPSHEVDETRVMEQDSELPELNFDPAESPSAFDPRVTGETDAPTNAPNPGTSEVETTQLDATEASAETSTLEAGTPGEDDTQGDASLELPDKAPSSWDEVNPFDDDETGPLGTTQTAKSVDAETDTEADEPRKSVKFGLLTWSLVMIVIGVAIIAMPWWNFVDWPIVGTAAFAVMGTIMLITALVSFLSESKSRKG